MIVQEFYFFSVWQHIFQVDKAARKHMELFHLRKSFNMQCVQLPEELLFKLLKFFFLAKLHILLPNVQSKLPIVIAPLAVFLIKDAIGFFAGGGIIQGHSTAVTNHLPRRAKKGIDRNIKELGQQF